MIRSALEFEARCKTSFWHSLILAAADPGGADVLCTEDLNHGQRYGRVMALNPFHSGGARVMRSDASGFADGQRPSIAL